MKRGKGHVKFPLNHGKGWLKGGIQGAKVQGSFLQDKQSCLEISGSPMIKHEKSPGC